jgi:single-strand DNA-binding protein
LDNGNSVCTFNVATSEKWKDKEGEKREQTEWHRIVCFGKTAELCGQYLEKGRQVYIEGKIQTRKWEDKDGVERWTTEIIARKVLFLGAKAEGGGRRNEPPPPGDDSSEFPF